MKVPIAIDVAKARNRKAISRVENKMADILLTMKMELEYLKSDAKVTKNVGIAEHLHCFRNTVFYNILSYDSACITPLHPTNFSYFSRMLKVSIIGSGNVAHHLSKAFTASDKIELVQVYARQKEKVDQRVDAKFVIDDFEEIKDADLYIIAVSDTAIEQVVSQLTFSDRLVAHTSGAMGLNFISSRNRLGAFYPLQTFSKNRGIDMSQVPICIESRNESDLKTLQSAAEAISDHVHQMDSAQRQAIHVAAVFASNFTNHMYTIASEICSENNISFDLLKPLISETSGKVLSMSPKYAQTGPARRNDQVTIERHLEFLDTADRKIIYSMLSQSIAANGKL
jgi:predicted short-subunit dehydrogenase-like oxidoreductase (DUF2520 family)